MTRRHKQVDCGAWWHKCLIFYSFIIFVSVDSFNLEVREPIVKRGNRSTYFGYSVAQHIDSNFQPWLLVGAPLGQNLQPNTSRSGALFKCPVTRNVNDCVQVVTDGRRSPDDTFYDDDEESAALQPPSNTEIKNGQWLGVTVKSQKPSGGGKVIVCAHRYIKSAKLSETHHGLGLCYLLSDTLEWEEALEPCEGKPMQHEHLEFAYCQAGTSLAFLNDGTALMGAPGPHIWRGTIFAKMTTGKFLTTDRNVYNSPLNHRSEPIDKYSYLGMSVTGGRFFSKDNVTYVSGAPRANLTGQVFFLEKNPSLKEMVIQLILQGKQVASNYGYELLAADVNGDGYDELFVSAPFYFDDSHGGAVYIYYNLRDCLSQNKNYTCEPDEVLYGKKEESRFGFSLTALGDINKDGYNDIAIGAPYEEKNKNTSGAIYVYLGGPEKLNTEPAQKIFIDGHTTIGYSLSGGVDLDGNDYPDLLVGAYDEDEVILFKTRQIIHIETYLRDDAELKNVDVARKGCRRDPRSPHTCFSFAVCIKTHVQNLKKPLDLHTEIKADIGKTKGQYIRVKFHPSSDNNTLGEYFKMAKTPRCQDHTIYIKDGIRDILSPIEFEVKYKLKDTPHSPILNQTSTMKFQATFLKDCGSNDVCESELHVSAGLPMEASNERGDRYSLDLGNVEELNVQVNVSNTRESAYEAQLFIVHSKHLSYIALNDKEKLNEIKCIYHNETWIACNLGNPLGKKSVALTLRFENRNDVRTDDLLEFIAFVNTTSNTTTESQTEAKFQVEIKMTPNIKINAYATQYVNYGGTLKGESAIKYLDEIGSRVLHKYQVTNEGTWSVPNIDAYIDWPIQIHSSRSEGKWLLYLEGIPQVESDNNAAKCEIVGRRANELNYTSRTILYDDFAPENLQMPYAAVPQPVNIRKLRQVDDAEEVDEEIVPARLMIPTWEHIKNNYTFDCATGTAKCVKIKCTLGSIPRNSGAIIKIVSRLWNSTLIEDFSDKTAVGIISRIKVVIHSSRGPVKEDYAMALTNAFSTITTPESSIPWWVYLLAIIGGILLFLLVVGTLYCCGFFKRYKPPTHTVQTDKELITEEASELLP